MNEPEPSESMEKKCPQCGTPLPTGALEGLCPACLLKQGTTAETATQPEMTPFDPPSIEEVAKLFPQLEIIAFIGKGGMGAVYKARQPALVREGQEACARRLFRPLVSELAQRSARSRRALREVQGQGSGFGRRQRIRHAR